MIKSSQFDAFVDQENLKYGPEPGMRPPNEERLLVAMLRLVDDYHDPLKSTNEIGKLMRLQAICVACERYLEDARMAGGGYAGRVNAVLETVRSANADLRILKKARARANWLKLMPERNAQAMNSTRALKEWGNLQKIHASEGGKKVNDHYWKEVFDPRHRPPHSVAGYDNQFATWLNMVTPFQPDGVTRNPDYDPNFLQSFFEYLDDKGLMPVGFEYKYLAPAERQSYQVVVRGGQLWRKLGGLFDTSGWSLNNGFRQQDYDGSTQSMLNDHGIWVISPEGEIFSGRQTSATVDLHHSAFLGGAAIRGGGEWLVQNGTLKVVTGSSGHYTPTFAQFQRALQTLAEGGINLGSVAAEWCYQNEGGFYHFNAKQLAQPGVKADWLGWPKFVGQPLQPVQPLSPRAVRPIPPGIGGTPFPRPEGAAAPTYTAPPRQTLNRQWPPNRA